VTNPQPVVVPVLASQLGKTEVDALCAEIDKLQAAAAPATPFIIDMALVSFAGSLAMGTLVGLHQEFKTRGQRLIFAALQPNVAQSFKVTRISQIMEIAPDVPSALQRARGEL
jgi:anti-anti-sigma factor